MKESPKVSVVMSVYNGELYLREAVDSILDQTFTDFEFIIIDDGSTDTTWQILSAYNDPRTRLVRNHENIGLTRSLNKALALARGEYVARQDADDVSLPWRLARQVAFLDATPGVGLVSSSYEVIDPEGRRLRTVTVPTSDSDIRSHLYKRNPFCHGAAVFRHACIEAVGGYRESFRVAQDYDLWLRMAERFELANLGDPLYRWRLRPEAISSEQTERQLRFVRVAQQLAEARRRGQGVHSGAHGLPEADARKVALAHLSICGLLYDARLPRLARERFAAALSADGSLVHEPDALSGWAVSRLKMAYERSGSYDRASADMINLLAEIRKAGALPRALHHWVLSEVHMAAAFESYSAGELGATRRMILRGIWHNPRWLANKGVLSILGESVLGCSAAGAMRQFLRIFI